MKERKKELQQKQFRLAMCDALKRFRQRRCRWNKFCSLLALCDLGERGKKQKNQKKKITHSQQTPAWRSDHGPCGAPSAPCVAGAACSDDPSFHSQSPWQRAGSVGGGGRGGRGGRGGGGGGREGKMKSITVRTWNAPGGSLRIPRHADSLRPLWAAGESMALNRRRREGRQLMNISSSINWERKLAARCSHCPVCLL